MTAYLGVIVRRVLGSGVVISIAEHDRGLCEKLNGERKAGSRKISLCIV